MKQPVTNANTILEDVRQTAVRDGIERYKNFVAVLKAAIASTHEPGRLTILFKIGAGAMMPGENGEAWALLTLATADSTYEPLLVAYRHMIRPGAEHGIEGMAAAHAPAATGED